MLENFNITETFILNPINQISSLISYVKSSYFSLFLPELELDTGNVVLMESQQTILKSLDKMDRLVPKENCSP